MCGWAKAGRRGFTAATDPRVARAAAAHRGQQYERRTPFEQCRWQRASRTTLPLEWSDSMAYIVGLTATDGCLVSGRRAINFKSRDRDLVETYLRVLGRTNAIQRSPREPEASSSLPSSTTRRCMNGFAQSGLRRGRA